MVYEQGVVIMVYCIADDLMVCYTESVLERLVAALWYSCM